MKRSKVRLNKRGKILLLFICVIFLVIFKLLFNKNKDIFNYYEENSKYNIKINYNKTNISKVDNEVKKFILDEKDKFKIDLKSKENKEIKYDLIVDSRENEYKDILFIHVWSYKFIGGNHYNRNDICYAYNKREDKFVDIKYFLKDSVISELDLLNKKEVLNYIITNNIEVESTIIDNLFNENYDTYKYFSLNEKGISFTYPPFMISSWSDGEIIITIPWSKLKKIIKEEYYNDSYKEDTVVEKREERNLDRYKDKKLIAITFDDGPNRTTTTKLLDGLITLDAKVTFFVVGSRIPNNEDVIKRAYIEGNDIGNHSYSHQNLTKISDRDIISEINKTNSLIKNVIGENPIYLRPPYGEINNHANELIDMSLILWNIDTLDWKYKDREIIKNEIIKNAHDGAIVLLHDIYEESVMGALLAMKELEKENYAFVTISEMAKLKNISLDNSSIYRFM